MGHEEKVHWTCDGCGDAATTRLTTDRGREQPAPRPWWHGDLPLVRSHPMIDTKAARRVLCPVCTDKLATFVRSLSTDDAVGFPREPEEDMSSTAHERLLAQLMIYPETVLRAAEHILFEAARHAGDQAFQPRMTLVTGEALHLLQIYQQYKRKVAGAPADVAMPDWPREPEPSE